MSGSELSARLRKPLERAIAGGHPWIYRDALQDLEGEPGQIVTVLDRRGRFLARGLVDSGPIGVRVWTTADVPLDQALLALRLGEALARRDALALDDTDALRLVHGEGDRMPGLVLDRYASCAVLRLDGAALDAWRERLLEVLRGPLIARGVTTLIERSGRADRKRARALWGSLPPQPVEVREHGMRLLADLVAGQKTGLFLDHRDSRRRVRELSREQRVLNLFGYTGAFSVAAGLGGASHVVTVDSARPAVQTAERTWALNALPPDRHRALCQDVEGYLAGERALFDLVIADPPSFAPRKAALGKALHAYRALHRGALQRVRRGGLYLAASCSSHVTAETFEIGLREASSAAGRRLRVLERWGAAADHPVLEGFAEGAYLKVVLARVDG